MVGGGGGSPRLFVRHNDIFLYGTRIVFERILETIFAINTFMDAANNDIDEVL